MFITTEVYLFYLPCLCIYFQVQDLVVIIRQNGLAIERPAIMVYVPFIINFFDCSCFNRINAQDITTLRPQVCSHGNVREIFTIRRPYRMLIITLIWKWYFCWWLCNFSCVWINGDYIDVPPRAWSTEVKRTITCTTQRLN